jgi:hypothetical protein
MRLHAFGGTLQLQYIHSILDRDGLKLMITVTSRIMLELI